MIEAVTIPNRYSFQRGDFVCSCVKQAISSLSSGVAININIKLSAQGSTPSPKEVRYNDVCSRIDLGLATGVPTYTSRDGTMCTQSPITKSPISDTGSGPGWRRRFDYG